MTPRCARARVEGTVQGVGFRPYVYRLAGELGLAGYVLNDARGVVVEVEARARDASSASSPGCRPRRRRWRASSASPPRRVEPSSASAASRSARARRGGEPRAAVSPDSATCADCLAELFDPADRRYRYPFINCTNCGPRFTIVRGVPYDRPLTTMAGFEMCARLPRRVRGPGRPPLPRPAERLPGLRAARAARRRRRRRASPTRRADAVEAAARALRDGRDRRGQGARRLPPRLPRRRRGRRGASCARASTARTSRSR